MSTVLQALNSALHKAMQSDERVILLDQRIAGKGKAQVNAKVLWRGLGVPVEFRLLQRGATCDCRVMRRAV